MREWIRRFGTRTAKFNLFRSVWFANLDCMVNIVQYLQDDNRKHKQCSKSSESNKSSEPKQCCESTSHTCTNHSTRTCNCTGHDCVDNDNRNTSYFGSHSKKRVKWGDICTKPRYKYYDDVGYRESTRSTKG